EAEVRICEATLSRTEEECHPTVRGVRAGESVLGAEKTVALGTGLARERRLLITGEPPKQAEDRKKPNPSACTGLAEHLLPRRHGLIQSFPNWRRHWDGVRHIAQQHCRDCSHANSRPLRNSLPVGHRCRNSDPVPRSHVDCGSREQTARQDSNEFSNLTHCSQTSAHELNVR